MSPQVFTQADTEQLWGGRPRPRPAPWAAFNRGANKSRPGGRLRARGPAPQKLFAGKEAA